MITIHSFCFNPFQENTYLLADESGNAMLIDPGCYFTSEREQIEQYVKKENLDIKIIFNTHCHIDHILGLEWACKYFSLPVTMHKSEQPILDNARQYAAMFGFGIDSFTGKINFIEEGEELQMNGESFHIIHAPGHSPGSICLFHPQQAFLIGGDVLFQNSIGRTDLPMGNHETLIDSIRSKLFVLPDNVKVYPGHGSHTTIGEEKRNNPYLKNVK